MKSTTIRRRRERRGLWHERIQSRRGSIGGVKYKIAEMVINDKAIL